MMEGWSIEIQAMFGALEGHIDIRDLIESNLNILTAPQCGARECRPTLFKPYFIKGMHSNGGKLERAIDLLQSGRTIAFAAKESGLNEKTASKAYHMLVRTTGVIPRCQCGRPSIHNGWCPSRIAENGRQTSVWKSNLAKRWK